MFMSCRFLRPALLMVLLLSAQAGSVPAASDTDSAAGKIAEIRERLDGAERNVAIFERMSVAHRTRYEEMEKAAGTAQSIYDFNIEVAARMGGMTGMGSAPLLQALRVQLTAMGQDTEALRTAVAVLAEAGQAAENHRQEICDHEARLAGTPSPSIDQIRDWQRAAETALERVEQGVSIAAKGVQVKNGLLSGRMAEIKAGMDKPKNELLVMLKVAVDAQSTFREAQQLATRAEDIERELKNDNKREELLRLKHGGQSELMLILNGIRWSLATHAHEEGVTAIANELLARRAAVYRRYEQVGVLSETYVLPLKAGFIEEVDRYIESLAGVISLTRQYLQQANEIDAEVNSAVAGADSLQQAARSERASADRVLFEARTCLAALAKATADGGPSSRARQALAQCDYAAAEVLISGMSPGPVKDEIAQELSAGRLVETELRSLVEQSRAQYGDCQYDQARTLLQDAARQARCPRHAASIADKLANVDAAQNLEGELRTLVASANALYRDCRFNKVRPILDRALGQARCADHKKSIRDKIEKNEKKATYEEGTRALFDEANELYREGLYADALAGLQRARERTTCQRFSDSLDRKIGIVKAAMGSAAPDTQATVGEARDESESADGTRTQAEICSAYNDRLARIAAEKDQLIEAYSQRKREGYSNAQLRLAACEVVEKARHYNREFLEARNQGDCVVHARSRETPAAIAMECSRSGQRQDAGQNCDNYQAQKDQAAARQKQLIERYEDLGRRRVSAAEKRPVACEILDSVNQIHHIMGTAINQGCSVGGHSVWLPPGLEQDCGQGSRQDSDRRECKQFGEQMNSTAQAIMEVLSKMQQLSGASGDNRAAIERLSCQLVEQTSQMKRHTDQAKAVGCPVTVQIKTEMLTSFARLCPGR
ncbi:hypothetical protein ACFL1S_03515 [Pseudomonadota bacterium]